ncbi:MAG: flagellar basal body rod protein FlgC [Deltaproteobacteria bacterium]|nr:MAG: flagellar basal body rod protein FlgC [Deltaproteobacteria bacterium]
MSMFKSMDVAASGLTAHRQRLDVIAENLANVHTTRTTQGGPYQRKSVVFRSRPSEDFASFLNSTEKVEVSQVVQNSEGLRPEHDPGHPDADEKGMVLYPNVNPVSEMVHLMLASRAYEANVAVLRAGKSMANKALDIGR